jgi:alginate O-acetyltransferase complex protein AlgJ
MSGGGEESSPLDPLRDLLPSAGALAKARSLPDLWRLLPSPETTRSVEKSLEEKSPIASALRPQLQAFLYQAFGAGNEQVTPAPGGWLFFRKDLDHLNAQPFLSQTGATGSGGPDAAAEGQATDPVSAIVAFREELAARGVQLLVVPVPVKPSLEAHRLRAGIPPAAAPLQNPSHQRWLKALEQAGVQVLDPSPLLHDRLATTGEAQYLRTDTHWTPAAMEAVASAVARKVAPTPASPMPAQSRLNPTQVTTHGDTVALLGLPKNQTLIAPQTVEIHPVLQDGSLWKARSDAEVLVLGDSFSNIYSLGAMGWGESAGFPEHLSLQLGRPLDTLVRNSDGAFATRQMLQKELASGNDRLKGKSLVIWEFSTRELSFGRWKHLPLPEVRPVQRSFFSPAAGTKQRVKGVVASASPAPRPGSVPYKEHILALHLVDVLSEDGPPRQGAACVVYTWSMRDQQPTPAARLRPGDTVSLELVAWDEVSDGLEKFQRSELEDPALLLEPATWAETVR